MSDSTPDAEPLDQHQWGGGYAEDCIHCGKHPSQISNLKEACPKRDSKAEQRALERWLARP